MGWLRIRNWEKYQKIAGNKAPYVQVQTDILLDMEFMGLPDRERLCFLLLLCLAGRTQNKIPDDPSQIMHLCHFDAVPDMSLLVSQRLLEEWSKDKHAEAIEREEERKRYERQRKRQWRQSQECPDGVPAKSASETETETETETEKKPPPPTAARFGEFWDEYPNKVGRKKCLAKWKSRNLDQIADTLIADVRRRKAEDGKWLEGFVPNPETYINGDRWEDAIAPRKANGSSRPDSKPSASTRQREAARRQAEEFIGTP